MKSCVELLVVGASLSFLVGCGGEDSDPIDAYLGDWLTTSMTITVGGNDLTLTRDGQNQSFRGDLTFIGSGSEGTVNSRSVLLESNLPLTVPNATTSTIIVDGNKLVTSDDNGSVVLLVNFDGDTLTLDLDAEDSRTTDPEPPKQIILERQEVPWESNFISKNYHVKLQKFPNDVTIEKDECLELENFWATVDIEVKCNASAICTQSTTTTAFDELSCENQIQEVSSDRVGYAEEQDGKIKFWFFDEQADPGSNQSFYNEFNVSKGNGNMTLTAQDCAPTNACNSAPVEVVLEAF